MKLFEKHSTAKCETSKPWMPLEQQPVCGYQGLFWKNIKHSKVLIQMRVQTGERTGKLAVNEP